MSLTQQKKSRKSMLLVLGAFILPIVLAKLALTQHWLEYGVTNQGTLVENDISLSKLGLTHKGFEKMWLLMYSLPEHCDFQCEQTLLSVNNTYIALGKDMPRVKNVALVQTPLSEKQLHQLQDNHWIVINATDESKKVFQQQQVLIVDALGNVVLSHQPTKELESSQMLGKSILADMKKLLKYSRIG